jgi:hypothetical protein
MAGSYRPEAGIQELDNSKIFPACAAIKGSNSQ